MISMLRGNGDPGVSGIARGATRDVRIGIWHLRITVDLTLDHGLGRLLIGVTLVTPLLDDPGRPVVVTVVPADISIGGPI
jgi:hypothetical protein